MPRAQPGPAQGRGRDDLEADGRPKERIDVVRLAHGWRVDHWAYHNATGVQRLMGRDHYAARETACRFAQLLSQLTGAPIFGGGDEQG